MSFTLNVEFSGLCLYVDDPNGTYPQNAGTPIGAFPQVHVLLLAPDMGAGHANHGANGANGANGGHDDHNDGQEDNGGHEGDGGNGGHAGHDPVDRHFPRVFYDTAYDQPNQQQLTTAFNCVSLEDKVLDLTRFRGTLDTQRLEVPDVSTLAGSTVIPTLLGDAPDLPMGRVSLADGTGTSMIAEGPWELDPASPTVNIAHKVGWTLKVGGDLLEWGLLGLNGLGGHPLPPLHPVGGEITLKVKNVMRGELFPGDAKGSPPKKGDRMAHFDPFFDALVSPKLRVTPVWRGADNDGHPIGGNYRCGGARASA
jgi:hypothetical protein